MSIVLTVVQSVSATVAVEIMQDLIDHGTVIRGWLGIETQPLTLELARSFGVRQNAGVLVAGVFRRSPAQLADIYQATF